MQLTGVLPDDIGTLPSVRELELSGNVFDGPIPASLAATNSTLTSFKIADNAFEGDLLPLADVELVQVEVHRNPGLCGMVRAHVAVPACIHARALLRMHRSCAVHALSCAARASRLSCPRRFTLYLSPGQNAAVKLYGGSWLLRRVVEHAMLLQVPNTVRFAHGYNPAGTRLGQPC